MLKKIAKFIKYNTLAAVIIAIAFVAVASAMADEETRNKVIGEEIVEKSGVDNTALLAADLDNFDVEMKITGAMEDPPEIEDGNYYIDYQYKTLAIKDNVWQEVLVKKQMVVSKKSLAGRDLGLYVKEELGEIIDYQLAYLKKVQDSEAEKGRTVVLETTEYTGLIGMVLDTKTKELPGYEPVVKPVEPEVVEESEEGWEDQEDWEDEYPLTSPSQGEEEDYPEVSAYQEWVKENVEGEIEEEEGDLGDGKEEEIVSEEEDEEKDEGEKGDLGNQGDGDLNDQGDNLEDQGDQEDLEEDQNEEELIQGDDEFSEEQLEEQLEESEQSGEEEASTDEDLGNQGNQRD